ncbi:biotin--acetyl-CoA-carboxylase ligase [Acetobacter nitrogenifigens DSM 23921 = NBRC 105050]|uniref:biotin--[biotin carboxyl-carrier protein] ligase n=1 Tax=Acetobacter nitrogenifigens DSM 23921 = NBRC 105050 TaxID=1120919 RepID=A0A511XBN0_9PROT|nr:biotin--[acetyl-CoA-carboxylase] ligase [Acetobacter nitrogenifigens]GBQ90639.1 biotin--acetyl-CoA-carboxylase ligase [Acetobacter nitrogenifigens DSM 23921 = NBRC 105050]GEN60295.1 biotin--[acetyl-CoA-carboxylase] ligase [Acetobacter nitrogenifigens DSM 23921 = NBRC 105050]
MSAEFVREDVSGWRLELHDELSSTSDVCIERADLGEAEGLALLARRQTKGRGTRGRAWADPGDSLALSVLMRPEKNDPSVSAPWSFISALAYYDALADGVLTPRLRVKWPNDILLDGHKLAGILVEASGGEGGWVVIGFGANIRRAPEVEGRTLACLAQYDPAAEATTVARRVLSALTRWRAVWERDGFAPIRQAWLERGPPRGAPLVVSGGKTYVEGEFEGIDEGGELLLRCGPELKRIVTGEILYGDAALIKMEAQNASGR